MNRNRYTNKNRRKNKKTDNKNDDEYDFDKKFKGSTISKAYKCTDISKKP